MKIWKSRRDHLARLIIKLSDLGGGDDIIWLKEYGLEIINRYRDNLEEPIAACEDMIAIWNGKV